MEGWARLGKKNNLLYDKMKKQHADNLEIMRKQPHLTIDNKNSIPNFIFKVREIKMYFKNI